MGLLDGRYSDDPDKNASINQGLLAMGLGLLNSKGSFGNALGQAGLMGMDSYQSALQHMQRNKSAKMQQEAAQLQIEAAKQAEAQRQRQQSFLQNLPSPGGMAMANGQGPTMENAARMPPVDPMQQQLLEATRAGVIPYEQYLAAQNKTASPIKLEAGDQLLDPKTFKPLASNPKSDSQSPLGQLIAEMNSLPPNDPRRGIYMQAIQKATTHQPAVNVNYGTPMPAVNPRTGEVELMRPDNKGGMTFTGIKPPPQDRDVKLPAELQRMQIAGDSMVKLMDDYEAMLKKHNPRDPLTQANPAVRADMQALKRNIELQFKELQALGALAGPDIEIMRQSLSDPFTMAGAYYGRDGLLSQVKRARELVKTRADAVLKSQGRAKPAEQPQADPLGIR